MAGRGGGKGGRGGKTALSFHVSNLGFSPGEQLPSGTIQPPPSFPPLVKRPTPLSSTEVDEYLLALSQEFRGSIRDSPYYLKPKIIKKDIVRYTDRYKQNLKTNQSESWQPDWNYVPLELKVRKPAPAASRKVKVHTGKKRPLDNGKEDIEKKLNSLIESEARVGNDKTQGENEVEAEEEEEFHEEEFEDDNDYNFDYYNDGGDKYGEDDDGEEGPVY